MAFLGTINYSLADKSKKAIYQSPALGEKKSQTGQGISIWAQNVISTSPVKTTLKKISKQRIENIQEQLSIPALPEPQVTQSLVYEKVEPKITTVETPNKPPVQTIQQSKSQSNFSTPIIKNHFPRGTQWRGFESNHEMPGYLQIKAIQQVVTTEQSESPKDKMFDIFKKTHYNAINKRVFQEKKGGLKAQPLSEDWPDIPQNKVNKTSFVDTYRRKDLDTVMASDLRNCSQIINSEESISPRENQQYRSSQMNRQTFHISKNPLTNKKAIIAKNYTEFIQSDFHSEYQKMISQNPYGFKINKGYCSHLIEQQGIYSKKHIRHFIRDGNQKIQKAEEEHAIDPAHRCERHDRHKIMPGYRNIPEAYMPDRSKTSMDQSYQDRPKFMMDSENSLGSLYTSKQDSPRKEVSQGSRSSPKRMIPQNDIKMMSIRKMMGTSAHKRISPRTGVKDQLETNVRDFKKLFNKIRIQSNASNRVQNSPYYHLKNKQQEQMFIQQYASHEDVPRKSIQNNHNFSSTVKVKKQQKQQEQFGFMTVQEAVSRPSSQHTTSRNVTFRESISKPKKFVDNFELKQSYKDMLKKNKSRETLLSMDKVGSSILISARDENNKDSLIDFIQDNNQMQNSTQNEDYVPLVPQFENISFETMAQKNKSMMDYKTIKSIRDTAAKERIIQAQTDRDRGLRTLGIKNLRQNDGVLTTTRGRGKKQGNPFESYHASVLLPMLGSSTMGSSQQVNKSVMEYPRKKI